MCRRLLTRPETLSAKAAAALDQELMSTCAFSIDQLMELAGLSVSQAGKSHAPLPRSWDLPALRSTESIGWISWTLPSSWIPTRGIISSLSRPILGRELPRP